MKPTDKTAMHVPDLHPRYEHKVVLVNDDLEKNLTDLGSQGFRVVATVSGGSTNIMRVIMEKSHLPKL